MDREAKPGRPPRRRPPTRPLRLGPRVLAARRARYVTVRLPVPDEIVAVVRFGTEYPDAVQPSYWEHVQEELEAFITSQVPEGAVDMRLAFNQEQTEVLVSFLFGSEVDVQ